MCVCVYVCLFVCVTVRVQSWRLYVKIWAIFVFRHANTVLMDCAEMGVESPFFCVCSESVKSFECECFASNVVLNVLWENGRFHSCCGHGFV